MSRRAIEKLRQDREVTVQDEVSDSDDEDVVVLTTTKPSGFASMMNDSSSSSGEDSAEDDSSVKSDGKEVIKDAACLRKEEEKIVQADDNLDALLEEFKEQDETFPEQAQTEANPETQFFDIITSTLDIRDLDFDFVMRTSMLGSTSATASARSKRRGRQSFVFGPPKDGWPRPPRYIGGGIGMNTYDVDPRSLPWPYSDMKEGDERCPENSKCFIFQFSDSYQRDRADYDQVKASGDANMLALFCVHHPFMVAALLQLSSVLYQTNQSQEGRSLLQRALWVFECAFLNSFANKSFGFMDYDQPENRSFFETLFWMVRISHVAGLPRSAIAFSKLLLSLDPLRDPMNILLILDYFVLLANTDDDNEWMVEFVESKMVSIYLKDTDQSKEYQAGLDSLPNVSYSYALALYRIYQKHPSPENEEKAKVAMRKALSRFPSVFEKLLLRNEVDLAQQSYKNAAQFASVRSTTIINIPPEAEGGGMLQSRISQAFDLIERIFVDANYKLWCSGNLHRFMVARLDELEEDSGAESVTPLHPSIMRYASCDPADYVDRFQTMPAEVDPLDRGLVVQAIHVDPNRPRFMQRMHNAARGDMHIDMNGNLQRMAFAGPPTENVDPDWPLLEVFWRSALPWTHVEGMEPPPR